jgi:ribosomal protein L14E/L6E/L27E
VIILNGRYAGKKGVIVKTFDDGIDTRKYGHAVVAGIAREPLKVTKSMPQKKVDKRSRVKPFLKIVNFNHLMPTRSVSLFFEQRLSRVLTKRGFAVILLMLTSRQRVFPPSRSPTRPRRLRRRRLLSSFSRRSIPWASTSGSSPSCVSKVGHARRWALVCE